MKKIIYLFFLLALALSCTEDELGKSYPSRMISQGETFNDYPSESDSSITFIGYKEKGSETVTGRNKLWFQVKFGDTIVKIQTSKTNPSITNGKFLRGKFMNTQRTCLLVQISDNLGLRANFYLIALKNHRLSVTELTRPSTFKGVNGYAGLIDVGSEGYLINNEFLISYVNAKVHFIKRQDPEVPLQGQYYMKSPDHQTFVFLQPNSLYQVNYLTDETLTLPLNVDARKPGISIHIHENYAWKTKRPGVMFLMEDKNALATK
ncbi:MAG: hypothetical protein V4687_06520 [Bacteroidota bacterium]